MTNPLVPAYFRVTIVPGGLTGGAPADGFIDNTLIEEWGRLGSYPSTLILAKAKARANSRFKRMIELLSENQSINHILEVDNAGASADAPPTSFSFTIVYDREEYVYTHNELVDEIGHATEGVKILEGADAIKRQVARVFASEYNSNVDFPRDPVSANVGYGWIDEQLIVGTPLVGTFAANIDTAEANITVEKIANT